MKSANRTEIRGSRWMMLALCCLVFIAGSAIRIVNIDTVISRSPDETTYAWLANFIVNDGMQGLKDAADLYREDTAKLAYPTPARAGYLYIVAAATKLTGSKSIDAATGISCGASILTLLLVGWVTWRYLSPAAAVLAMALYAFSPPVLAVSRRAWQEAFVELLIFALLALMLEGLSRLSSTWAVAAGALAGASITVKEIAVVLAFILSALFCMMLARKRAWKMLAAFAASVVLMFALCFAWCAHIVGGVGQWFYFSHETARLAAESSYARISEGGTLFAWLRVVWESDPLMTSFALIGIGLIIAALIQRRVKPVLVMTLVPSFCMLVLPMLGDHRYNLRFIAPAFALFCIVSADAMTVFMRALLQYLQPVEAAWTRRVCIGLFACAMFTQVLMFHERYVDTHLQDLSLKMLESGSNTMQ